MADMTCSLLINVKKQICVPSDIANKFTLSQLEQAFEAKIAGADIESKNEIAANRCSNTDNLSDNES